MRRGRESACGQAASGAAASKPPSASNRRLLTAMASPSGPSMGSGPENFTCRLGALLAVVPGRAGLAGRHRLSQRLDRDCGIRLRERDRDGREEDEGGKEQGHEQEMLRDPGEWRQAEVGFIHGALLSLMGR